MRDAVEYGPRDLLDEVDLARHVAGTPCRDGHVQSSATSKPSRSRIPRCSSSGPRGRSGGRAAPGRTVTTGRSGRPAWTSPRRSARRRSGRRAACVASTAAGSARCGSTPFSHLFEPSVRSPEPLRRLEHADRLEVRRLEQHLGRRPPPTSDSSPPMIAASATAFSPSVISRSRSAGVRRGAVERPQLLALVRAADDDPAAGELRAVERMERAPPARA